MFWIAKQVSGIPFRDWIWFREKINGQRPIHDAEPGVCSPNFPLFQEMLNI